VLIRNAAKKAFTKVRSAHLGESFYAFAVYTDEDFSGLSPACNSEEPLARRIKEDKLTSKLHKAYARWLTAEWAYEGEGAEEFSAVDKAIHALKGTYAENRNAITEATIGALLELDSTGFFGVEEERKKVTLILSITDSQDAEKLENESAKLLNPPSVAKKFIDRYK
jgi:hypothetical protein